MMLIHSIGTAPSVNTFKGAGSLNVRDYTSAKKGSFEACFESSPISQKQEGSEFYKPGAMDEN